MLPQLTVALHHIRERTVLGVLPVFKVNIVLTSQLDKQVLQKNNRKYLNVFIQQIVVLLISSQDKISKKMSS
jgi:hypothetical protein